MTPVRLTALVARALHRQPTRLELDVWGEALACRGQIPCPPADCPHDDEADQALRQHVATSTYPPTPADVRRIAIGLANTRVEAEQLAEREAAREHAVPPTEEYLAARAEWARQQAKRAAQLEDARTSHREEEDRRRQALAELDAARAAQADTETDATAGATT